MINLTDGSVLGWLGQFSPPDQVVAADLLQEIRIVSADELTKRLTNEILSFGKTIEGPIGLFTERHIRRHLGVPNRLFREARRKPHRAEGHGPAPVPQGRIYARETGSEGVIATLITSLARANPGYIIDHPGPDLYRSKGIRAHIIVTDFIGSGQRACANLEAAWRLATFKSWKSFGLVQFVVVSFAATVTGAEIVKSHRSAPTLILCEGCPTLSDLPQQRRLSIEELLSRYGPNPRGNDRTRRGYGDVGALIAFDHGIPNNAPLLLHQATKFWKPLFPSRSLALLRGAVASDTAAQRLERDLKRLNEHQIASAKRVLGLKQKEQSNLLVLISLKRAPRTPLSVSSRTQLPVALVEATMLRAQKDGFLDSKFRLTLQAYKSFSYLRRPLAKAKSLVKAPESYYVPSGLRPPRKPSR